MLIALVGTRFSGKTTVQDYFVSVHGFSSVQIVGDVGVGLNGVQDDLESQASVTSTSHPPSPRRFARQIFTSAEELLLYITKHWKENFITIDLCSRSLIEVFRKRPFFLLVRIDAPLYTRFLRSRCPSLSLSDFVQDHDRVVFGRIAASPHSSQKLLKSSLQYLNDLVDVQIDNSFETVSGLHEHLADLNLLDPELLRPSWDAYFMTLASLTSQRSNCMKRRVGAVLVRDNRVVSTGYNGTPRGLRNCNDGGCSQCNGTSQSLGCLCLHAEENTLLEVGRERVGLNAVLYCNTCPCLGCTIKIIQTGVKIVVYNQTYKVDDKSASLFQQAGVELRRYNPNKPFRLHIPTSLQGPWFPSTSQ